MPRIVATDEALLVGYATPEGAVVVVVDLTDGDQALIWRYPTDSPGSPTLVELIPSHNGAVFSYHDGTRVRAVRFAGSSIATANFDATATPAPRPSQWAVTWVGDRHVAAWIVPSPTGWAHAEQTDPTSNTWGTVNVHTETVSAMAATPTVGTAEADWAIALERPSDTTGISVRTLLDGTLNPTVLRANRTGTWTAPAITAMGSRIYSAWTDYLTEHFVVGVFGPTPGDATANEFDRPLGLRGPLSLTSGGTSIFVAYVNREANVEVLTLDEDAGSVEERMVTPSEQLLGRPAIAANADSIYLAYLDSQATHRVHVMRICR